MTKELLVTTQSFSHNRPKEGQTLEEFRAQLPVIKVSIHEPIPETVIDNSTEGEKKRPTWLVAGSHYPTNVDTLGFYVDLGFEIVAIVAVDSFEGSKIYYSVKLPPDGSIGICREPAKPYYPTYLIHDHMGQLLATSYVDIHQSPSDNRHARGYLLSNEPISEQSPE